MVRKIKLFGLGARNKGEQSISSITTPSSAAGNVNVSQSTTTEQTTNLQCTTVKKDPRWKRYLHSLRKPSAYFRFFDLPREVRDMIYRYAVQPELTAHRKNRGYIWAYDYPLLAPCLVSHAFKAEYELKTFRRSRIFLIGIVSGQLNLVSLALRVPRVVRDRLTYLCVRLMVVNNVVGSGWAAITQVAQREVPRSLEHFPKLEQLEVGFQSHAVLLERSIRAGVLRPAEILAMDLLPSVSSVLLVRKLLIWDALARPYYSPATNRLERTCRTKLNRWKDRYCRRNIIVYRATLSNRQGAWNGLDLTTEGFREFVA